MAENSPIQEIGRQRVVLEHTNGPYAGLRQIVGTLEDYAAAGITPPSYEESIVISPGKRTGSASLIRCYPSYYLYREVKLDSEGKYFPVRAR